MCRVAPVSTRRGKGDRTGPGVPRRATVGRSWFLGSPCKVDTGGFAEGAQHQYPGDPREVMGCT